MSEPKTLADARARIVALTASVEHQEARAARADARVEELTRQVDDLMGKVATQEEALRRRRRWLGVAALLGLVSLVAATGLSLLISVERRRHQQELDRIIERLERERR